MLWSYCRNGVRRTCEVRLAAAGPDYELVITEEGRERVESFTDVASLLSREHQLLTAWRAQGWQLDGGQNRSRS
jgi:hypothetical protein